MMTYLQYRLPRVWGQLDF